MSYAISVNDVSKRFKINHERYNSLKERALHFGRKSESEDFYALSDIDLQIEAGTTIGLLGHNGSGKSTLLECVAGILRPTSGSIQTVGRMAALLELGAGFNGELTGRENIFMNGTILGMSKRDIEKRFDDIVEFAELERFIDTQVRFYSSGMYVRLGFAVAVNVEPEILLVDEVLAVGDEAFQNKCLTRVKEFQEAGRTIVVVTHSPSLVRDICDRGVVLEAGRMIADGVPSDSVRIFRQHLHGLKEGEVTGGTHHSSSGRLTGLQILHSSQAERDHLEPGESLAVRVTYESDVPLDGLRLAINFHDQNGTFLFGTDTERLGLSLGTVKDPYEVRFEFPQIPFLEGSYEITAALIDEMGSVLSDWRELFVVKGSDGHATGMFDVPAQAQVTKLIF